MTLATDGNERVTASPNERAVCPGCGDEVIAKCGSINRWHWAHRDRDCDSWSEPETEWHLDWKEEFPKEWREVALGCHRADVMTNAGVIEFQHSSISADDILERESFYRRIVWVLDASGFRRNIEHRRRGKYDSFRWKHPRKSWWHSGGHRHTQVSIYLDYGYSRLFQIRKLYGNIPCGGWGTWVSRSSFISRYAPSGWDSELCVGAVNLPDGWTDT
jgi:competence CoiA-like predicted nuclease